jgi:hypothetical protein
MVDRDRREVIKAIAKGAIYVSPLIVSMAAPAGLMGQGPSGNMMMFCDYFPILCMIFGGSSTPPGATPAGQQTSPAPSGQPPFSPPPSQTNPPPGAPPP